MNFKRFLLLAVFLMAPGMAFGGGTINRFEIMSNVHPVDAPGANLEVWFGVDGYNGWNNYQVQSISIQVNSSETACLDVEPDITLPGQYKATGFTDNDGSGFSHSDDLYAYRAYGDDDCDNHNFSGSLFSFNSGQSYQKTYFECFIAKEEPQSTSSSGESGKSRLQTQLECSDLTTFKVQKRFTDGNDETGIILDFWCNNGTYSPESVPVTPDNGSLPEQTFIVEFLEVDDDTICTVTERPVDGYDTSYLCRANHNNLPDGGQSTRGEDCVTWDEDHQNAATDCNWSNVWPGQENTCLIENTPTPVDVEVTKVWDVTNTGGDYFDTTARLWIECDGSNDQVKPNDNGDEIKPTDYTDDEYTLTVQVIPDWYPTETDPKKKQKVQKCWAWEDDVYDSAVEEKSTCGDSRAPGMSIMVGEGDSCVITNTVFFEGIPTLNQYGMAIMALLMLGMGFVGFRRFV